jgi:hypothetical protein
MKKVLYLLLALIAQTNFAQYKTDANHATINMAVETYGFLAGHFYALSAIDKEFPKLHTAVANAQRESDVIFKPAKRNIQRYLEDRIGADAFKKAQTQIDSLLADKFKAPISEPARARAMLDEVQKRCKDHEPAGIYNAILAFAFFDEPEKEFDAGHIKQHKAPNNSSLTVAIPLSWTSATPEHSNTLQHFANFCGTGDARVMTMAFDNPFTNGFSQADAQGIITPDAHIVAINPWKNDTCQGYVAEIEEKMVIGEKPKKIRMLQFMFVNNNKLYCLQGSVGPLPLDHDAAPQLNAYRSLFGKIAGSVSIGQ